MTRSERIDKELDLFRNQMLVPSTFEDGFSWTALAGALFVALVMVPGSIYMGLLAGHSIGPAAQWVTVILFLEVARRAHRHIRRSEMFVLFFMAGTAMGVPFQGLLWNQFFLRSDAAAAFGVAAGLPSWFAPAADSSSYEARSFFQPDWLPVIGLVVFGTFFGQLSNLILGYGLFRLTSDVEELPFPMAPVGAQGIMALAEDVDEKELGNKEDSWRWRVFSIGGALGLAFGSVYLLLPTLSGAVTGKAIQVLPIPFSDFTGKTQIYLPAVATGLAWDMGFLINGMVLPFFGMLGSFIGLVVTILANPLLYDVGILHNWQPGDDTIATAFKNNIDFYFSFQIGVALAIALFGIHQVVRALRKKADAGKMMTRKAAVPPGRGDVPPWIIFLCYFVVTMAYILVSGWLIDWHPGIMIVLVVLGFFYTPLVSYVTARLEGMVGQIVEVPFIREASMILSGYQGVKCWFLPVPMANYGQMTVFYRQCELTGTKFTSIWKTNVILYPLILVSSIFFMNFIWGLAEVPSAAYPYAQKMWELQAANACILYSATSGEYSIFEQAFNVTYIACGGIFGIALFGALSSLGAPVFLMYGVVRGLGQNLPHFIIPEFVGALIGRYYFQKKLGLKWRQYVPVVAAGFSCGMGLITTAGVGITFLSKAVIQVPY